jgi:hypothetical protein
MRSTSGRATRLASSRATTMPPTVTLRRGSIVQATTALATASAE